MLFVSIGCTAQKDLLNDYVKYIISEIEKVSEPACFVLPEYCWGEYTNEGDTLKAMTSVTSRLKPKQYIVLGTFAKLSSDGNKYNTAILANKYKVIGEVQKIRTLKKETKVKSGMNDKIIEMNGLRVCVVVCADLWDNTLIHNFVNNQKADIILVPAFTATQMNSDYAKYQWYSLAITRSREFAVPIVVADHIRNTDRCSVGNATCIVDPSKRSASIKSIEDFLELSPETNDNCGHDSSCSSNSSSVVRYKIDFKKVSDYKNHRKNKGLSK